MNTAEIFVFIIYLLFMLGIGFFFFFRDKNGDDKSYFLGGRKMGAWVTALSAGDCDAVIIDNIVSINYLG